MSYPAADDTRRLMQIGLIAYGLDGHNPNLVFVRVPTERGRWVLTDRCVVEVECRHCTAMVGEPCRRGNGNNPMKHGAGTHCCRRGDWQRIKYKTRGEPMPKLRLSAEDLAGARGEPDA